MILCPENYNIWKNLSKQETRAKCWSFLGPNNSIFLWLQVDFQGFFNASIPHLLQRRSESLLGNRKSVELPNQQPAKPTPATTTWQPTQAHTQLLKNHILLRVFVYVRAFVNDYLTPCLIDVQTPAAAAAAASYCINFIIRVCVHTSAPLPITTHPDWLC